MTDIVFQSARKLSRLVHARKLSAVEVVKAFIAQVERVNPKVNAIVTFLPEEAIKEARKVDARLRRGSSSTLAREQPLLGLPIAYKDTVQTKGIRTTFGSPIYADNVPGEDALIVERLRAAGAITLGKTNAPEFAAGSQTFNKVFGATLNPYDVTKTCGGSSGGAAVAVACGMLPFADGTDLGGSLRNPGNFNNVVGFRPTPGRVPMAPMVDAWGSMTVMGPIARTVEDAAFLLSAMAGPDPRVPVSLTDAGSVFARPLARDFKRVRVAFWPLDAMRASGMPLDPRVAAVIAARRKVFESLGCIVEDDAPDLDGADEAFNAIRALSFVQRYAGLLEKHRSQIKDTVVWNIEEGLKLTAPQVARALNLRSQCFQRMRAFLERHEFLVMPVNQVPPFPVTMPWVAEIDGVKLDSYVDWMRSCSRITVTSHPAISVPAGFTGDDLPLPVGVQIVGRYRDDFGLLQLAHAFERAKRVPERRPPVVE